MVVFLQHPVQLWPQVTFHEKSENNLRQYYPSIKMLMRKSLKIEYRIFENNTPIARQRNSKQKMSWHWFGLLLPCLSIFGEKPQQKTWVYIITSGLGWLAINCSANMFVGTYNFRVFRSHQFVMQLCSNHTTTYYVSRCTEYRQKVCADRKFTRPHSHNHRLLEVARATDPSVMRGPRILRDPPDGLKMMLLVFL